jgi:hypothetical protein
MAEEIIAITMKYRPVPILNVVVDTPEFPHGDTAAKPSPVPNDSRTKVKAHEAIAPASTAAHETPETEGSTTPVDGSVKVAIFSLPAVEMTA